jgi:hypothetical protein
LLCSNVKVSETSETDCQKEINDIASIWLQIFIPNCKSFLLNFVYRPHYSTQSWIDLYEEQIEMVDTSLIEYFIMGDLNMTFLPGHKTEILRNTKGRTQ